MTSLHSSFRKESKKHGITSHAMEHTKDSINPLGCLALFKVIYNYLRYFVLLIETNRCIHSERF